MCKNEIITYTSEQLNTLSVFSKLKAGDLIDCPPEKLKDYRILLTQKQPSLGLVQEEKTYKVINKKAFIIEGRKKALNFRCIAEFMGVSRQAASQTFRRGKKVLEKKITKLSKYDNLWKQLYEEGSNLTQIATKFKTSTASVSFHIRKAGGIIRKQGTSKNRFSLTKQV